MATRAYILVETAVGKTRDVVAALKGLEGVKSVDPVIGPFDVVAVVEAKDHTAVGELVTSRFHRIPGVTRTVSCLAI
jgi:DNA-binding Lrp family transcriptional regulator